MESSRVGDGGRTGLTVGFILIAAAIAILIGWGTGNWFYLVPVFLLELGAFLVILGAISSGKGQGAQGRSWTLYVFVWGGIMVMLGALLLLNDLYPNNVPVLIAVFLIFSGVVAIWAYLSRSR